MAILKDSEFDRTVAKIVPNTRAWLVHGTDDGLVSERAGQIVHAFHKVTGDPGDVLRLDDSDLAEDPDRLSVELRTQPMFGGPNAVRVRAGARLRPDIVEPLLEPGALTGLLVVEAGNLKKDAKIRKLFEGSRDGAMAIACYPDDHRSLERMIDSVFQDAQISADRDTRQYLADRLGADRGLSRGEVEKLALYAGTGATITSEDIDAIVGDAVEQALDRIIYATFNGRPARAIAEWDRALAAGQSPQAVLIALQRHATVLQRLHSYGGGKPIEQQIRSARPPIHFKRQGEVTAQMRMWSQTSIEVTLSKLQRATRMARRTTALETAGIGALIIELATHAAGRR